MYESKLTRNVAVDFSINVTCQYCDGRCVGGCYNFCGSDCNQRCDLDCAPNCSQGTGIASSPDVLA